MIAPYVNAVRNIVECEAEIAHIAAFKLQANPELLGAGGIDNIGDGLYYRIIYNVNYRIYNVDFVIKVERDVQCV